MRTLFAKACVEVSGIGRHPDSVETARHALARLMAPKGLRPGRIRPIWVKPAAEAWPQVDWTPQNADSPISCYEARAYPSPRVVWEHSCISTWWHRHILRHQQVSFDSSGGGFVCRCDCGARWHFGEAS